MPFLSTVVSSAPLLAGWFANTSDSKWISTSANPQLPGGISSFYVKTTVYGSDFAGGILNGRFSADDRIGLMYLNNGSNVLSSPTPNPSYGGWYDMPAIALNPGANELLFLIDNSLGGNYQGFRAEFNTNSVNPVPTPALLPGLIGMGVAALRRKSEASEEII